jgi:hypothetical protein
MLTVWYHDPAEVDPRSSWTGLTPALAAAAYEDITECDEQQVTELFAYARPDAVIDNDGLPVVSIEQTMMNPIGHNLPQRFSCLLRAVEVDVASVLYHPRSSRRTFSDPNVRYTNPRVALAQRHMRTLFPDSSPSVSLYWPLDSTLLPDRSQGAQQNLADLVQELCETSGSDADLWGLGTVGRALAEMEDVIDQYGTRIRPNGSYRRFFPEGLPHAQTSAGHSVDPPGKATLDDTRAVLDVLGRRFRFTPSGERAVAALMSREISLVFTATANRGRTDSEHPWPAYFALLDVLYARTGPSVGDRRMNMIYVLPISTATWLRRLDGRPAMMRIVDAIADVVVLTDGVVRGQGIDVPDDERRLTE